jgi:hypothetical protein
MTFGEQTLVGRAFQICRTAALTGRRVDINQLRRAAEHPPVFQPLKPQPTIVYAHLGCSTLCERSLGVRMRITMSTVECRVGTHHKDLPTVAADATDRPHNSPGRTFRFLGTAAVIETALTIAAVTPTLPIPPANNRTSDSIKN